MADSASADDVKVVILAGGQGTRFWPMSRTKKPKQFLSISQSGESLIQSTARRVLGLTTKDNFVVMTNIMHKGLINSHLPYARVICEPMIRNTAPSIGLAAIHLTQNDKDPVMLVLPADHAVSNEEGLLTALKEAVNCAAKSEVLVTLGIQPVVPHTGYGYIKKGKPLHGNAFNVGRFFEKPNHERAIKYFESGEFLWNSGMFAWRASTILKSIQKFMPELYDGLIRIKEVIGTAQEASVTSEVFEACESSSIDFGVLEHARNCAVIASAPFGWNDVGSWDAWAEHFDKDENGNLRYGDAVVIDGKNCVVHSQNRLIAVLGLSDLVVIDAGDAMLVCPRGRVQDVRKVVDELQRLKRAELI